MLSQTSEYALRAMACLAYSDEGLTTTPTLAEMTKVPSNYLAKVLQSLAQAELIIGRRGVGGGYRLARPADQISMLDIVNAIDPIERIRTCPLELSTHGPALCPLHRALDGAASDLIKRFGSTTLHDLISDPGASKPLCDTRSNGNAAAGVTISARPD
ncbi:MAG: RrF2 family transcriptional regulator [Phycisphaerales bacterium JB040]